jgi:hydrogenase assembly chaperone HypC/HupF
MCLMAPFQVVSVDGSTCEVESGDRIDRVSMVLEPDLQVGDWVLVNSGTVVRRLDPDQADEMSRAIEILFAPDGAVDGSTVGAAGG